jgi:hypothetical protein
VNGISDIDVAMHSDRIAHSNPEKNKVLTTMSTVYQAGISRFTILSL